MSIKRQATSDKRLSKKRIKIHEAWALRMDMKPQASSNKLPGSRYKSSDYSKRATNCAQSMKPQASSHKRQATSTRNPDSSSKRQAPSSDKNFSMSLNPDSLGSSFRPLATRSRIQEPS
jgi:hypothetical protein